MARHIDCESIKKCYNMNMSTPAHRFDSLVEPTAGEVVLGATLLEARERLGMEYAYGTVAVGLATSAELSDSLTSDESLKDEIAYMRYCLDGLSPRQKQEFSPYMRRLISATGVKEADELTDPAQWLASRKGASDHQVVNFTEKHVSEIRHQNENPYFKAAVETTKHSYISSILKAQQEGWVSMNVLNTLSRVENAGVYVGDVWDGSMDITNGYYRSKTDYIVVRQSLAADIRSQNEQLSARVRHTAPHEFGHLQGFGEGLEEWLDEALAEHLASALTSGKHEMVDPAMRGTDYDRGIYTANRMVLGVILSEGSEAIGADYALRAYTSVNTKSHEWSELNQLLQQSWGVVDVAGWAGSIVEHYTVQMGRASNGLTDQQIQQYALWATVEYLRNFSSV